MSAMCRGNRGLARQFAAVGHLEVTTTIHHSPHRQDLSEMGHSRYALDQSRLWRGWAAALASARSQQFRAAILNELQASLGGDLTEQMRVELANRLEAALAEARQFVAQEC